MGKKTSSKKAAAKEKSPPPAAPAAVAASASKRQRSTDDAAAAASKKVAPHAATGGGGGKGRGGEGNGKEEELVFEDPFGDEFDPEDIEAMNAQGDGGEDEEEDEDGMEAKARDAAMDVIPEGAAAAPAAAPQETKVWRAGVDELEEGDELEYDSTAYHMYHSLRPEWPCLSFDVIRDSLGTNRSRFPHTVFAVAGTQADRADNNRLQACEVARKASFPCVNVMALVSIIPALPTPEECLNNLACCCCRSLVYSLCASQQKVTTLVLSVNPSWYPR